MSITYVGSTAFERVGPISWSVRTSGIDQAVVRYQGAKTKLKAFLDGLEYGSLLIDGTDRYQGMLLGAASSNDDPVYPVVDLTYFGFRRGTASKLPIHTASTSTQSASASSGGLNLDVTYTAPESRYSWSELSKPADTPRYSTVQSGISPKTSGIIRYRVSGADGNTQTVAYASFVELLNELTTRDVVTGYSSTELVQGKIWECESTVARLLL